MHAGAWNGGITFPRPSDDGMYIISGMVVRVRVCVADVPLAMSRYFGHDGGHSIDFLLVLLALGSVSCYVHK